MSYFKTILSNHHLENCPNYLWEIKVTDEEYRELKKILTQFAFIHYQNCSNRFITISKECVLYIAEYWRREYKEGVHSIQPIVASLNKDIHITDAICDEFYASAKKGFTQLGLELFENNGVRRYLDSMLYQGGLPMQLLISSENNGVWDRFTRRLINNRINFEELNLGIVATQSQCLQSYCSQLIKGVETRECSQMPFYCQDEHNDWFLYLQELSKQEKSRRNQSRPFMLKWKFRINDVEKNVSVKYVIKGMQRLPQAFLEELGLKDISFFSVQIRKDGQVVDTFDYINNFCRHSVISENPYVDDNIISLFIHNKENPYIMANLNMNIPHLLYLNEDGEYELGNRIGEKQSILLIPENWSIENETLYSISIYTWGKNILRGLKITPNHNNDITVKGVDGTITFGKSALLYWTEIRKQPLYFPNIIEPLYNASDSKFALCHDSENGVQSSRYRAIQYRGKWQIEWSDTPPYGEIYAKATDINGNFATPVKFINIGDRDNLVIELQKADNESCQIKVLWKHGYASTGEGIKIGDDIWEIKKKDCPDPKRICFKLTPEENSKNQFSISIRAPFKEFSIIDNYGNNIPDDCWIPYSDIDKYQYHLVGQNISQYTYGNIKRELKWQGEELFIIENREKIKSIPYEGSLLTLFDSHEVLRSILDRTSKSIIQAEVKVTLKLEDGKQIRFSIKDSPFRPRQKENGSVIITGNHNSLIHFTGVLKLLKLDEPTHTPIEITWNQESSCYILPEEIRPWGKTILIGKTRGRICPTLVDLSRTMDTEFRYNERTRVIEKIRESLSDSHIGDELWSRIINWFETIQQEDIPASSILELVCVANDVQALLCLTFLLYAGNEDRDSLSEQLKTFSKSLAFQWYWLWPYLNETLSCFSSFTLEIDIMSPKVIERIYIPWSMKHEDCKIYLQALNSPETYNEYFCQCIKENIAGFFLWMKDLCIASMTDSYDMYGNNETKIYSEKILNNEAGRIEEYHEHFVDFNQEELEENVSAFFHSYDEPNKSGNEQWLYQRVNVLVAHLKKKLNLFSQNEEIRRSIIYCSKSCNNQFIIALNNKLLG